MVIKCSILGCTNRKDREKEFEFYRIPAVITNQGQECENLSQDRRREWLARIGQSFENKNIDNVRVCSAHFISGKKAYLYDTLNPDWAPTLNLGRKRKASEGDRYERMQKRREKTQESFRLLELTEEIEVETETGIETQTDIDTPLFDAMTSELQETRCEISSLKEQLFVCDKFGLDFFRDNNERVKHLTGLPSYTTLSILFSFVEPYIPASLILPKFKVMIMTLMKLRLNLTNVFLSYEFGVTQPTVSRLFTNTISALYRRLVKVIVWPERETLRKTMPMEFRKHFGRRCAVIIDCFEVFIEKPTGLKARAETWSSYKHHHTIKFLIGIAPQGNVSYISKAWGGRVSDKYITENSGFLQKLLPGDLVLADRGFDVKDSVGSVCAEVKIPAFTKGRDQLSPLDVEETRKIAHSRIHVERVIGSVRQKYTILNGTLPINFLMNKDQAGITVLDKIVVVTCALVNLCDPLVAFD